MALDWIECDKSHGDYLTGLTARSGDLSFEIEKENTVSVNIGRFSVYDVDRAKKICERFNEILVGLLEC